MAEKYYFTTTPPDNENGGNGPTPGAAPPPAPSFSQAPSGTGFVSQGGGGGNSISSPAPSGQGLFTPVGGNQITDQKSFDQANGQQQNQFLNAISPVKQAAYAADQAQAAAALGLGTVGVPAGIMATYAAGQSFRETRAAQVEKGAKGTDVKYSQGVLSPMYSEQVTNASEKGGNAFLPSGEFSFTPQSTATQSKQSISQVPQQQYASMMTQAQMNQLQTANEFKAAYAPGVVGGMSLASGGWMTLNEGKPAPVVRSTSTFDTRINENVVNVGATAEQWFAPVRGTVENFFAPSVKAYGSVPIIGDVAKLGYGLGAIPEQALVKIPAAAAGVGAMYGYRIATGTLGTPLPNEQQAFSNVVSTATSPTFIISTVALAGLAKGIGSGEIGFKVVGERVVSSEISPRTSILARTDTGLGTEFVARTSDTVSVTSAKTVAGIEIPFTKSTSIYSANAETSGISLNVPELSQTAKLGSVEGQSPMLVQTRAATGVELSSSVKGGFISEWNTKGIGINEISGYAAQPGASVGAAYGEFPRGIPYGEMPSVMKAPSLETTSFSVKYPTLATGEVFSEISPSFKGLFEPSKSPAQYTSDISSVRAVSSGGKISEISGAFQEMAGTSESSIYGISLKEGKITTKGIGIVEPAGGFRTPLSEGQVFPRFISPKDVTSFKTSNQATAQLQVSGIGGEATKAGTSAIQNIVGDFKAGQATRTATTTAKPIFGQAIQSSTTQQTLEKTQLKQASFSITGTKTTSKTGFRETGMVGIKEMTGTIGATAQATSLRNVFAQPTIETTTETTTQGLKITEITGLITPQQTTTFTPTIYPNIFKQPPKTPSIGLGGFDIGIRDVAGFGGKYKKQKGAYRPSFIALTLGIRTTKAQGLQAEKTGIDVRGIIGKKRR